MAIGRRRRLLKPTVAMAEGGEMELVVASCLVHLASGFSIWPFRRIHPTLL